MKYARSGPAFLRPAILEAILLVTSAAVGLFSVVAGARIGCTALVEFGMLSAIAAASAGALFARYAVEVFGVVVDYRLFEQWGVRLTAAGYVVLGIYALTNGLLDLIVPRHDPDWVSYPGLATAAFATLVTLLVLGSKYRTLEHLVSRSLIESLADDAGYLGFGVVTLAALAAHIWAPVWWVDTTLDAVVVALVAVKAGALRRRARLRE